MVNREQTTYLFSTGSDFTLIDGVFFSFFYVCNWILWLCSRLENWVEELCSPQVSVCAVLNTVPQTLRCLLVIENSSYFLYFLLLTNLSSAWTWSYLVVEGFNSSLLPIDSLPLLSDLSSTLILPFEDKQRSSVDQGVSRSCDTGFSPPPQSVDWVFVHCELRMLNSCSNWVCTPLAACPPNHSAWEEIYGRMINILLTKGNVDLWSAIVCIHSVTALHTDKNTHTNNSHLRSTDSSQNIRLG